jgi:hypothetical protein
MEVMSNEYGVSACLNCLHLQMEDCIFYSSFYSSHLKMEAIETGSLYFLIHTLITPHSLLPYGTPYFHTVPLSYFPKKK